MDSLNGILDNLGRSRLVVSGDTIRVLERRPVADDAPTQATDASTAQKSAPKAATAATDATISTRPKGGGSGGGPAGVSGKQHKGLHKTLHKGLHKGLHKNLHKAAFGTFGGGATSGLSWPSIEVPWRELNLLYDRRASYCWDRLDEKTDEVLPPPAFQQRRKEARALLEYQRDLREPNQAFRRQRIEIEAGNDLAAYMTPLGGDVTSPGSRTAVMFQTILWLGSLIGLMYKARYNAARPHVLEPALEPLIPVPSFSSYPSNHAFQSFLIAEVFNRTVPEHPGGAALYRAAGEVARNREWAGLHIPSDTEAGETLARLCGPLFEDILQEHIRAVRAEWLGTGGDT